MKYFTRGFQPVQSTLQIEAIQAQKDLSLPSSETTDSQTLLELIKDLDSIHAEQLEYDLLWKSFSIDKTKMTDQENSTVQINNEVKVKINQQVITLKPDIVKRLTAQDISFFRGVIDFYKNQPINERKPIDISSAPSAHRFTDLINYLEYGFSGERFLCDYEKPEELYELVDYLGILPENSLDLVFHERRLKMITWDQNRLAWSRGIMSEDNNIYKLATFIIKKLLEKNCRKFDITAYSHDMVCVGIYTRIKYRVESEHCFYNTTFTAFIQNLKAILNPRLRYMKYIPIWKDKSYEERSDTYRLCIYPYEE